MCDLITEHAAQLLGAPRFKSDIKLSGLSQHTAHNKGQTYLNIETLSGQLIAPQHPMLILDKLTVDLPRVPVSPEVFELTKQYCLADPSFHLPGRIDVVLGGALYPQLLTNKQFSLGHHMPHVVGTLFGYIVMGSAPCASPSFETSHYEQSSSHLVSLHAISDPDLHTFIQRPWTQEELIPLDSWRHIASADNPADCASRGLSASQLDDHALWWTRPPWLKDPHCSWPASPFVPVDISTSDEKKTTPLVVLTTSPRKKSTLAILPVQEYRKTEVQPKCSRVFRISVTLHRII